MRILDLFRSTPAPVQKELLLDESAATHWPRQLVEHHGLDREFKRFVDKVEELKSGIRESVAKFTDEDILSAVPDRARTINHLHGKEYASQVEKLLKSTEFNDLFSFEQSQERYFEHASTFKDQSAKHVSVLREFMHQELKNTQGLLEQLDDAIITFMKTLDERKFPTIRKLHESNIRLQQMTDRQEKYQSLLASLQADLKRTQEKRAKIEEGIAEQQALIRNEESLAALAKMKVLESEIYNTVVQYANLAKDLSVLYSKKGMAMDGSIKKVLSELQRDAHMFLSTDGEQIKLAFTKVTEQLEDENLGNRNIFERLTRLAASAEADGRKIATSGPDLRALKKDMMRDVASLQVYDKTQFLMRAQAEENAIRMKIEYIQQEMDPNKRMILEREMKDHARSFGAVIKAKEPQ